MSDFAFMRFMSNNLLTQEESQHKDEIVNLTEQVLDAKGLECDERVSKLSEEKLREILEEVRKLRHNKKRRQRIDQNIADSNYDGGKKKEVLYANYSPLVTNILIVFSIYRTNLFLVVIERSLATRGIHHTNVKC